MASVGDDWRDGAAYDYFDELTPEQITFEFLRRNQDYAASYRMLADAPDAGLPAPVEFALQWGLRFRGRPKSARQQSRRCLAAQVQPVAAADYQRATPSNRRAAAGRR